MGLPGEQTDYNNQLTSRTVFLTWDRPGELQIGLLQPLLFHLLIDEKLSFRVPLHRMKVAEFAIGKSHFGILVDMLLLSRQMSVVLLVKLQLKKLRHQQV